MSLTMSRLCASSARSRRWLFAVQVVVDMAAIMTGYTAAFVLRFHYGFVGVPEALPGYVPVIFAAAPVWLAILAGYGLYEFRPMTPASEVVRRLFHAVNTGIVAVVMLSFLLKEDLSRGWVIAAWGCCLAALVVARLSFRKVLHVMRGRGRLGVSTLVVGTNDEGRAIARSLSRQSWLGMRPIGFLVSGSDGASALAGDVEGLSILGTVDKASEVARRTTARMVVVAGSALSPAALNRLYRDLQDVPVEIAVSAGPLNIAASRVEVEPLDGMAVFSLRRAELTRPKAAAKRAFDLVGACVVLLMTVPIIAAAAIAIRLSDRGTIFFRQTRIGKDGRRFRIYKLRTMFCDAEARGDEFRAMNQADGHLFKIQDDPRVTKVGRVLRHWALDELPQLFNVIRGDMSLVGPRPPLPGEVAAYDEPLRLRLKVKPGMTGLWQANGRHDLKFDDYVRYDLFYVENWSLAMDLHILWKTIPVVLSRKGAY